MKFKFSLILVLMFISLISLSLSAPTWWTEGNEGARYGAGGNYWFYASPYLNDLDNTDFSSYSFSKTHKNLITTNLLNDYGSENHFYYFSGTQVYYMDNEGNIKDSYTFAENVERIDVINLDSDNILELLIKHGDYLTALTLDENFKFEFVRSWDLVSNYDVDSYEVDFSNSLVFYLNENYQYIYIIDLLSGVTTSHYFPSYIRYSSYALNPTNNNPYLKIDSNAYLYLVYPYNAVGQDRTINIVKFDYYDYEGNNSINIINDNTPYFNGGSQIIMYLKDVKIFYLDNFYFKIHFNPSSSGSASDTYHLVDSNSLLEVSRSLRPNIFVGDVNKDGNNEVCSNYGTYLECLNSLGNVDFFIELEDLHSTSSEIVLGNYNNDSEYMNIITPCKVYELVYINDTYFNTTTKYNLSLSCSDTDAKIYPVGLYDKQTFIKDLILTDNNQIFYMYISGGEDSVCGDGVCDIGETMVNCPSDCLTTEGVYTFNIKNVVINPSINGIIQNGSRIRINYDVVPNDNNVKYQTQTSISYNDGVNYTTIDGWSNINTQTKSFVYDSYLTQLTEIGKIKIEVRIFGQEPSETLTYDFITRTSGITYGEVVYSETPTSEEARRDNALYNAFLYISSTINVSVQILGLLIIFFVMMTILFYQRNNIQLGLIASGLMGFIGLVLFVLTGIISIGILITIVIILLIVLGIGFTNKMTGER